MRAGMLALAAGLLLLRFLPQLPSFGWLLALAPVGLLLLPFRWRPLAFFLFGLVWACLNAQWALDDRLPVDLDGRTFWLEGQVTGLPDRRGDVVRFELEDIHSRHAGLPSRIRLAWYGGPEIRSGERWRLAARLKRPSGMVNPSAFDYEAWLLARRIGATGTIKAGERIAEAASSGAWRDRLRQRLLTVEAHGRAGAIAALVVGDGSGLSTADWRVLQDTGTVHLMVISGQHVGMLAGLLYAVVLLLARWGIWPQRLPWLPWACGLAFAGALGYGWLAGFEVPVRRACLMVAIVLLWRLRFRHLGVWLPLLIALVGVLMVDPLASLQPGFWLSFVAVALLIWIFRGRLGVPSWWRALLYAQWAMALGLLPAMLVLGLPVSLSGPLANLLAVPWISVLVVPLALLGSFLLWVPWLGEALLWLAGGLLAVLFELLALIAGWQPAWLASALPLWAWSLVALGTLVLLLPAGVPLRVLGTLLLAPLLFAPDSRPEQGRAEVWVFDVGQGLSVLVRTRDHALLYDAGPRYGDFDIGERVVFPSLRQLGLERLDLMMLSHADSDHAGGALAIQRAMPVGAVLSGEPERLPAALDARSCRTGQRWTWNQVNFSVWRWPQATNGNQASCVLMVEAAGERLLLTGDIDAQAERALVDGGMEVNARWLLAPHHGSNSSSSAVFLAAVAADGALISRSSHNAFGHPHPAVLKRLQNAGAELHDTAEHGALSLQLGAFGGARRMRDEPRFWREK
ncbi:DNA internalization-related competence protein ComEC/Rec2 [Stutzerimonas stutzeri DSM 10701]|uniref:Competence protein n=1 Tax=Stutzerimonas stutzeri TaxID=316 RepID=Q9XAU3_STUST|nr:DNA internalization-related competence protein ComEC/Rec2 [Stutzerimonas nitrititolerans]AFN78592.1 DNA internalization-related competence protein ComEC/Rec2 [Stutzerimonas stutzeri DSM 10701]CAB50917.1 competence protein [Stutzerimonas stutzeri]